MRDKDIVEVSLAANTPEAHLIKSLLEDNGIQARIVDETMYGAGPMPFDLSAGPRIWTTRADAERARQIIEQWETEHRTGGASSSLRPWACPHCGQEVPGEFDVCWNCEYARNPT
jgi:hypothetical protein